MKPDLEKTTSVSHTEITSVSGHGGSIWRLHGVPRPKSAMFRPSEVSQASAPRPDRPQRQKMPKPAHKTPIRSQNPSSDHEFSEPGNQSEIIPERPVDGNGHNLASDTAQDGPNSPQIARH